MAKIKYSALVSGMRNKLNGSVLSRNRYGDYMRNKTTPVNPQTAFQLAQRAAFGNLSSMWRTLTEQQRQGWRDAASDFPVTDIFGDQMQLAGNSLFIALNRNLINAGVAPLTSAPLPESTQLPSGVTVLVDSPDNPPERVQVSASVAAPANSEALVYAAGNIPPGTNYVKNRYRLLGHATMDMSAEDFLTEFQAHFGSPQSGLRQFFKIAVVNTNTGQLGLPVEEIVVAG